MIDKSETNVFRIKHKAILEDINYNDRSFDFESLTHKERVKSIKSFLKAITRRVGCSDYLFTLGITELYERYGKAIVSELWEILDTYYEYSDKIQFDITCDEAFAAFYCLVHHYYRASDCRNLKKLLMPKEDIILNFNEDGEVAVEEVSFYAVSDSAYNEAFGNYPLIFELLARYYAVLGDFVSQLKMARVALKRLNGIKGIVLNYGDELPYEQQGENYGVKISCAGAVCAILEDNYLYGALSYTPKRGLNEQSDFVKSSGLRNISIEKSDMSEVFGMISGCSISETEKYIDEATFFAASVLESDYPKYHYLKAKIKFYSEVLNNFVEGNPKRELKDKYEIEAEIEKAVKLEEIRGAHDADKRTYTYTCLKDYVNRYTEANLDKKYHKDRKDILSAPQLKKLNDEAYPNLKENNIGDYVFVSYSSADFKPVYCDLLEMERAGINYWYDRGTRAGLDWKEVVRQRIRGCSVVLYYMSEQSIASTAVMDELNYILQLKKPVICINLCDNSVTSKTLINIIRYGSGNFFDKINSNTFKTVCTACPNYIVMLQRDRDPLNVYHIKKLRKDLFKTFPSTIRFVKSENAICGGSDKTYISKSGKTVVRANEDYLICDELNKIYIVVDGISRSPEEYKEFLDESENGETSIARKVSEVFADTLHELIKETILYAQTEEQLERDLKNAFETANNAVEKFLIDREDFFWTRRRRTDRYYEKPGCVAVASFLFGGKFYYGSVGDCMCILIRNGKRIILSDKQTDYAFTQMNVEKDRYKLNSEFVNKHENFYGYGVVNGDKNASKFFAPAHIELETGDEIYIVSDGLSDYIKYGDVSKISKCSLKQLMEKEDERRAALGKRTDDKAVIRIKIN